MRKAVRDIPDEIGEAVELGLVHGATLSGEHRFPCPDLILGSQEQVAPKSVLPGSFSDWAIHCIVV